MLTLQYLAQFPVGANVYVKMCYCLMVFAHINYQEMTLQLGCRKYLLLQA